MSMQMSKPLKRVRIATIPPAPDLETSRALRKLSQHKADPAWLPEGRFPDLDDLRVEHHRHLEQTNAALAALAELDAELAAADASYNEKLREAARDGTAPPDDDRLSPADRAAGQARWRSMSTPPR